ncbi:MFS transporter [Azospirillum halopraeferens]|uniref:MFS transporter n=1 Tax=Azospirillum halopraeferens TaxID=34010 RepID=UPI00040AAFED|nr:MFS transporter [Azospirillum halopraeferens]
MAALVRPVLVLLVAMAMMMAGTGTLGTLLSVRMSDAAQPPLAIGVVMAGYFAGLTIGSLRAFTLIRAVGHIRAFSALAAILAAATLGHSISGNLVLWGVLRLIAGFCMAGLFVCVESWLNHNATAQTRGQILSFYMISVYGGQGGGQFLLNLQDETGRLLYTIIAIVLALALVPVALTRQTPPQLPNVRSFGFARLYAASPLGVFGTLISGLVTGALYSLAPAYARQLGYDTADTALFMSAAILGGVLLQWPLGRLSDVFDRRKVLVVLFAALVAVSAAMALAGGIGFAWLLVLVSLFGGITFALYPLCVAHTNDHLDPADMVSASGGLVLGYSIGATAGPFGASIAMTLAGPPGLFLFCAIVAVASVAFGLWRMAARDPVPAERQGPFHVLTRTTPVAAPLDPRSAPEEEDPAPNTSANTGSKS